jgi:hypothetical protein
MVSPGMISRSYVSRLILPAVQPANLQSVTWHLPNNGRIRCGNSFGLLKGLYNNLSFMRCIVKPRRGGELLRRVFFSAFCQDLPAVIRIFILELLILLIALNWLQSFILKKRF